MFVLRVRCPVICFFQVITLEGELLEDVAAATSALGASLPEEFIVKVVADDDLKDI